jgi:hypothetical protein
MRLVSHIASQKENVFSVCVIGIFFPRTDISLGNEVTFVVRFPAS